MRIPGSLRKGPGLTHAPDAASATFRPSCGLREVATAHSMEWKDTEAEDIGAGTAAYQPDNLHKVTNPFWVSVASSVEWK